MNETNENRLLKSLSGAADSGSSKCLTEEQLAAYQDNVLHGEQRVRVEKHLAECPDCRGLFAEDRLAREGAGDGMLRMPAAVRERLDGLVGGKQESSWLEVIIEAGKAFVTSSLKDTPSRLLAPVPVRGAERQETYSALVGGKEVQFAFWQSGDGTFNVWLRLKNQPSPARQLAWEIHQGASVLEHQPAKRGEAVFKSLAAGSYWCVVWCDGRQQERFKLTFSSQQGGRE